MAMAEKEFKKDKNKDFSDWYNTVIYAADLVDNRYNVQGFIVHKPMAMRSFKKMYAIFEKELEKDGHQPSLFPTVIPEENFELEKKHAEGFVADVFWITERGSEKLKRKLALRPTSETAMYQMYSLWVRDHTDLPVKLYQSCTVFRNESETSPFLRGREFLWIEAHDAFATEKESKEQIAKDMGISARVLGERLALPFMFFDRPKWDTFPGAEHTYATDILLPDGKTLQVASTHLLGQNFAKAFNVKFKDAENNEHFVHQTCYGPGIWRIMAAVIAVHGDDRGLVMPPSIAPIDVVIVPIIKSKADPTAIVDKCRKLKDELIEAGLSVELDLSDKTPGFKYAQWEMKGVPVRVEIGEKEVAESRVTLAARDTKQRRQVSDKSVVQEIRKLGEEMAARLKKNADDYLVAHVKDAESIDEIKEILDKTRGYARVNIHSVEMDGKECADTLQFETKGGKVRGVRIGKDEKPSGDAKCVVCGKPAKHVVYIARQY
ncbi:Proline--tRNA ligase [uncultured archaeon]|nr:Proline--tRNA ligase [uncultured archaeon]